MKRGMQRGNEGGRNEEKERKKKRIKMVKPLDNEPCTSEHGGHKVGSCSVWDPFPSGEEAVKKTPIKPRRLGHVELGDASPNKQLPR